MASAPPTAQTTNNSTTSPMVELSETATGRRPMWTRSSVWGWVATRNASGTFRNRMTHRRILIEPAVEPAQPPANMRTRTNMREKSDHWL